MTALASTHQRRLPPSSRGRAQDQSRDDLIIGAALELLSERGYNALTMTDVAARAGVSKATLYRRWTAKADLVADAVATMDGFVSPNYTGRSVRNHLLTLLEQAANCDGRPEVVTATFEMARSHPDLYRTLSKRFAAFIRAEIGDIAERATGAGHAPLSKDQLESLSETVVALLAHHAGPKGASIPRERLIALVDNVLLVLLTGKREQTIA
jgi:AcrR family transcriptional regulator